MTSGISKQSRSSAYLTADVDPKASSGIRQAIVATAHKNLIIAYHVPDFTEIGV